MDTDPDPQPASYNILYSNVYTYRAGRFNIFAAVAVYCEKSASRSRSYAAAAVPYKFCRAPPPPHHTILLIYIFNVKNAKKLI